MRSVHLACVVPLLITALGHRGDAQTPFFHPLADTASAISYTSTNYSPGACLAGVERAGATARRAEVTVSNAWNQSFLEHDTVLAVERQTASACVAQHDFSHDFSKVDQRELPNLARLYWFIGDTVRMRQAITTRLAADQTDSARAATYLQLLTRFAFSKHRDIAFVSRMILPGLDSLTSLTARMVRLQAHAALAHAFASSQRSDAGDSTQAEIAAAMASFARMPAIVQNVMVDTIGPLFKLGAVEAVEHGDTALARVMLETARKSLSKLQDGARYVHNTEEVVRYFGMTAPPVHADFVYGAGPHARPDEQWPRPGRWTLISPMASSSELGGFYQHIHTIMGDTLDIVFYVSTHGSWRPRGPLTPPQESQLMYDYLSRRWGIPGILLVETGPFHLLPDGRRMNDATLTPDLYSNTGLLIDPQGTIRAMIEPSTLVRFDRLVTTLMHGTVVRSGR